MTLVVSNIIAFAVLLTSLFSELIGIGLGTFGDKNVASLGMDFIIEKGIDGFIGLLGFFGLLLAHHCCGWLRHLGVV